MTRLFVRTDTQHNNKHPNNKLYDDPCTGFEYLSLQTDGKVTHIVRSFYVLYPLNG